MKQMTWLTLVALMAGGGGWMLSHAADRQDTLPEDLVRLVQRAFPNAGTVNVERRGRDSDVEYRVRLKNADDGGITRLELSSPAGITEIEEELKPDQLPPSVLQALKKEFPRIAIRDAEKRSEIRVTYRIDATLDGRRREITVSPRGRILEIEKRN